MTVINCGGGVKVEGDGHYLDIDGLTVIDTPTAIDLDGDSTIKLRNFDHR